jgi:hypothetical protein
MEKVTDENERKFKADRAKERQCSPRALTERGAEK